jgi:hypothetical protein
MNADFLDRLATHVGRQLAYGLILTSLYLLLRGCH